jgi:glycosyltransferase involved in cell wall biosynthesis
MRSAANAAIVYVSGNYDTATERLMGRHSASEGFLRGFARYSGVDTFYCYSRSNDEHDKFQKLVHTFSGRQPRTAWIPFMQLRQIAKIRCLYRPGPNVGHFAWERRRLDNRAYSICGVTHTTAEHQVMDAIGNLLVAPVQSWDALVCTSHAVQGMVERLLADYGGYLEERFGTQVTPKLQLPIIPLGVDSGAFPSGDDAAAARKRLRQQHGIASEDIVVLFVGRLNAFEKANPLQMYACLEAAAGRTRRRIHLVQAGWFAGELNERAIREGAEIVAPSVRHLFLDGRTPDIRRDVWACADIFVSLSDNVQETFGLTPIEAMAAGLPVIVSDWNGYRDTVRDKVDGFRIPTLMPGAGAGDDIAFRYAASADGYGVYCARSSQFVSVDAGRCVDALASLIENPELRRKMGAAGRTRAREVFDWQVVIAQYQALWTELEARRRADREISPRSAHAPADPLRGDPFWLFQGYPSATLEDRSLVALNGDPDDEAVRRTLSLRLARIGGRGRADDDEVAFFVRHLRARGPSTVAELRTLLPRERQQTVARSIAWMSKLSLVLVSPQNSEDQEICASGQENDIVAAG